MTDNMKKFLEKVSSDKKLSEQLNRMTQEQILRTAEELGIALTAEDFKRHNQDDLLRDDELTSVAGGFYVYNRGNPAEEVDLMCDCTLLGSGWGKLD